MWWGRWGKREEEWERGIKLRDEWERGIYTCLEREIRSAKEEEVRVRFYLISFSREESPSPLHLTHRKETREIRTWHLDFQGKINPADCAE